MLFSKDEERRFRVPEQFCLLGLRQVSLPAKPSIAGRGGLFLAIMLSACTSTPTDEMPSSRSWDCVSSSTTAAYLQELGCFADFDGLASEPLSATISGARSVKTIIDRYDDNKLYFQDSNRYPIHWDFASAHLSGEGRPVVPMLSEFNTTEYSAISRRFLLGSVTYYEGPGVFVYEIAPYDTATPDMIVDAFTSVESSSYFGSDLRFHASSAAVEATISAVADQLRVITSDELYAGIDYQALNIAQSTGRLRFVTAETLETDYLSFRDIVVIDQVPNDISVVSGIITQQFQTPLSHINVLSRNRGTPNMALRGAFDKDSLRALDGKWVRLSVEASDYKLEEISTAEADEWWQANKPSAVQVPGLNDTVTDFVDIKETIDLETMPLKEAVKLGTRAFGGKAAHYGALAHIEDVEVPKAFSVPVYYYLQFMEENGFRERMMTLLADPDFRDDPAVRDQALKEFREDMKAAPLNADFLTALLAKLNDEYSGIRMRFRSSTNAEDLDGFTGAGLYTSKSGDPSDLSSPVEDAVRKVWASVWFFRAFEERSYRSIDHLSVAMALLVHRSFPDEEANGVALTNNPFDSSGLDPAFYINVQRGETSVVLPPPGVTADSFLYYYDRTDQPISYLSRSNITVGGEPVLTRAQTYELGTALSRIRSFFATAYGSTNAWWAMDVEFKFDGLPGEIPKLYVKQARPYQ